MEEQRKTLTLFELNALVRQTLELGMPDDYWVEAELSEVHEVRGHCYMELIQKDDHNNTPVAKASAKCWASTWRLARPHFERVTGQQLHAGMKVLLKVSAQFHENYGFSWIVTDIDPTYTMGDMARKRQEIIRQLKEEGVFDLQKELQLPMFCQRIAVISSANAAGYGDFVNQLENNDYGFRFHTQLFPAVMQGEGVEQSVIAALNKIFARLKKEDSSILTIQSSLNFDCVVIIRGGGATSDLSGFDTLALAENVANFPLPVITGIGHERDESVLDMVSHTRVKTPTAAAAFLISNLKSVLDEIEDCEQRIHAKVKQRMDMEKIRLLNYAQKIPMLFSVVRTRQEALLGQLLVKMRSSIGYRLQDERHRLIVLQNNMQPVLYRKLTDERHQLDLLSQRLIGLDPNRLLKRGYSITLKNGRTVRDVSQLKEGDELETRFENGTVRSVVNQVNNKS
ncbi:MAG: exodeoxyribonuclease VII large subunit [Prevotella sp.]|nr:exodeoxyribonuclease VII large subunit [Prevotella sp.]